MTSARRPATAAQTPARAAQPLHGAAEAGHDAAAGARVIESAQLFGEDEVVFIQHDGALYRLQRTRLGKLILTK